MNIKDDSIFLPIDTDLSKEENFAEYSERLDRVGFFMGTMITIGMVLNNRREAAEFEEDDNVVAFIEGKKPHSEFHKAFCQGMLADSKAKGLVK